MTRDEVAIDRAAIVEKIAAITRARTDRDFCIAAIVRRAVERGNTITWTEVE